MRNFTIHTVEQRGGPWRLLRLGRVTGSRAAAVVGKPKRGKGELAPRRDLRTQLVIERITGQPQDDPYQGPDMQRGIELEPAARMAYEARTANLVRQTGFLKHNDLMIGSSLDGDVDDLAGIVEIKCPRPATHLHYIQTKTLPEHYRAQIVHNLLVSGAQWADFVSYSPAFPDPLKLIVVRVDADPRELAAYELELRLFLGEVEKEYQSTLALQHAGGVELPAGSRSEGALLGDDPCSNL